MKAWSGAVLPGLLWGALQACIVAGSGVTGLLLYSPTIPHEAVLAAAKHVIQGSIVLVALLAGYALGEAETTMKALFLSQVVADPPSFGLLLVGSQLSAESSGYQAVFIVGLTILFLIYGILGSFSGVFLASWMSSLTRYSMNIKLVSIGLALNVVAVLLPFSSFVPWPSSFSQDLNWYVSFIGGSSWPIVIAFMSVLILTGSALALLGMSSRRTLKSRLAGLLVIASLVTVGLTSAALNYVYVLYDWCVLRYQPFVKCGQAEDFLHILWILPLTLLAPAFVVIRSVTARFHIGVVDSTEGLGPSPRQDPST